MNSLKLPLFSVGLPYQPRSEFGKLLDSSGRQIAIMRKSDASEIVNLANAFHDADMVIHDAAKYADLARRRFSPADLADVVDRLIGMQNQSTPPAPETP